MTLAEVLPAIKQLSTVEKLKLIKILAEDLETGEEITPLEPNHTYNVPTVYDSFGAGAILMEVLKESEE